jgi:tellurite methyltransferase
MTGDRESWNLRWRERGDAAAPPSSFVLAQAHHLPPRGRALDVAGGAGRHAVWLAARGLDVTLVDVADAGLELAARRAAAAGVALTLVRTDLDHEELPGGSWGVILVHHFLCRALWHELTAALAPGGLLLLCQPTSVNLERHLSPGPRFLVHPGELEAFARSADVEILHSHEGWNREGRHEAELVVRRMSKSDPSRETFRSR